MNIQEAIDYLNYCAKENGDEPDLEGKSDKEIIELANMMMERADAMYESWKESYGLNE